MAYEVTKQNLKRERKAFLKRLVVAGASGAAGLALGVSMYDMGSLWGVLSASVLATCAGFGAFYVVGVVGAHS
ncbi:hypothetical protein [Rubrivivax gelatinosus]|uniref:hypothetical protein n=1 Tax=Rubrivivax gelatinosus TaxID=28068 RepID=UPI0018CBB4BF|nr:hypothetical protein [Rubrivivax gelatinosus]